MDVKLGLVHCGDGDIHIRDGSTLPIALVWSHRGEPRDELARMFVAAPDLLETCRAIWGMASEFLDDGPGVGRADAADEVLRRIEEYAAAAMARADGLAPSPDAGRGDGGEEG